MAKDVTQVIEATLAQIIEILGQGGLPDIQKSADGHDRAIFKTLLELGAQELQMRVYVAEPLTRQIIVQFAIATDRLADNLSAFATDQLASAQRFLRVL